MVAHLLLSSSLALKSQFIPNRRQKRPTGHTDLLPHIYFPGRLQGQGKEDDCPHAEPERGQDSQGRANERLVLKINM